MCRPVSEGLVVGTGIVTASVCAKSAVLLFYLGKIRQYAGGSG